MKFTSRIYRNALLPAMAMLGALTTSCTDYLTIIPSNMVVEEKFWQTQDQVNGMLANEKFVSKAPQAKIDEEKAKQAKYAQMMEQVKERLAQLTK